MCVLCLGFDGKALIEGADRADVKSVLKNNTDAAIAAGLCGVPTYEAVDVSGNRTLLWGQDRLNVLADIVHGWVDAAPKAKL